MTLNIYRTTGFLTRSILRAEHVAETESAEYPDDPQAFAAEYDGDILEPTPDEEKENG